MPVGKEYVDSSERSLHVYTLWHTSTRLRISNLEEETSVLCHLGLLERETQVNMT